MKVFAQALRRGAAFLIAGQDRDGAWRDFDLRPGVATSWTTAFVAPRLAALADIVPGAALAAERAAAFLRGSREAGGGWAYNARCPADADSTALALLFLHPRGAASLKDAAVLASFQTPGGGFATYKPWRAGHPWAQPSAEVTATALRALGLILPADHVILRKGGAWLREASGTGAGAYWWTSGAYLALELARLGLPATAPVPAKGAFALALNLERAALTDRPADPAPLLEMQCADGGWPTAPILKVPNPAETPEVAGLAHQDQNRLFTTATAVSALDLVRRAG